MTATTRKRDASSQERSTSALSPSMSGAGGTEHELDSLVMKTEEHHHDDLDGKVSFLAAYERQSIRLPPWFMSYIRRWRRRYCRQMRFGNATFRFIMLFLTVLVVFSGYFSYDLPGITSEDLKKVMSLTNTQLGVLFSVYAFPNAFLPLLSGAYYSSFGIWKGVLMIATCIAAGIAVVSFGTYANSYWLMVLGRAIYGLGGESVYVGVDVLATDWFKDAELGLAYGLIQSAGQAGSFAAFYGVPWLTNVSGSHVTSYAIAVLLAAGSLGALFFAHGLEQTMILPDPHSPLGVKNSGESSSASSPLSGSGGGNSTSSSNVNSSMSPTSVGSGHSDGDEDEGSLPSSITAAAAHVASSHEFAPPSSPALASPGGTLSGGSSGRRSATSALIYGCLTSPTSVRFGFHHLAKLNWEFYAVLASIATYSGCFYTFLAFGNDYLQTKYGMHAEESGQLVGIISIFSCFISPIAGLILDKRGGRSYAACAAMLGACAAFSLMGFTDTPVTPCIVLAGICYAILPSALYPMIADTVPEEAFAQVYAIINACVNMLLMMSFYGAGALSEAPVSLADSHGGGGGHSGSISEGAVELAVSGGGGVAAAALTGGARMLRRTAGVGAGGSEHGRAVAGPVGNKLRFRGVTSTDHHKRPVVAHRGSGAAAAAVAAVAAKRPRPSRRPAAAAHGGSAVKTAVAAAVAAAGTAMSKAASSAVSVDGSDGAHVSAAVEGLDHGHHDPSSVMEAKADYHYVFYIFVAYTLAGALATGLLAVRDYRAWRARGSHSAVKKDDASHSRDDDVSNEGMALTGGTHGGGKEGSATE